MKQINRLLPALAAIPMVLLRVLQNRTGFDDAGLSIPGNFPGIALRVLLIGIVVFFIIAYRAQPSRRSERAALSETFRFEGNSFAVSCAVAGSFLLFFAGVGTLVGYGSLHTVLLAPLAVTSALCLLYAVFGLYRGNTVQGIALLAPVCSLVVYLILLYRADASNPVLAQIYMEVLAAAALTYTALELAAFAFRDGSRRGWLTMASLSVILAFTAAADGGSPARAAFFVGSALVALGFLAATDVE